jgi:uncharacterized protein (DUF58 family)
VVVYPRLVAIRPPALPRTEFFGIPGGRSPVADPVHVFGTRDYHGARPARAIHWKASARHDRLQEKLCEPAEQQKVMLLLDVDGFEGEAAAGALESTLEVVASLAVQLDRRGIPLALATNGRVTGSRPRIIPVSRRPDQAAAILETLAGVTAQSEASVTDILSRGGALPRSAVSAYFAHCDSRHLTAARQFLKERRVPARFFLAAVGGSEGRGALDADDTQSIEKMRPRGDHPQ